MQNASGSVNYFNKKLTTNFSTCLPKHQRKTMNAAFKSATQWMRPAAPLLTHQQTVTRLYRSSLKCMMSWAIQRDIINEEAFTIRQRFEANRAVAPDSP